MPYLRLLEGLADLGVVDVGLRLLAGDAVARADVPFSASALTARLPVELPLTRLSSFHPWLLVVHANNIATHRTQSTLSQTFR